MSPRAWGRRDFLRLGGGAVALAGARPGMLGRWPRSATRIVRMGFVLPPGNAGSLSGTEAGILLGREEAEQVGALLGVELDVRVERAGGPEEVDAAGARLMADGVEFLVGAVESRASRELGRTASRAGVPFVDALPADVVPPAAPDSTCALPAFRVGVDHATGVGLALEALALDPSGGPAILVGDRRDPQLARARNALSQLGADPRFVDASTPAEVLSDELGAMDQGGAAAQPRVLLVGPAALAWAFSPAAAGTGRLVFATTPLDPGGPLPAIPVQAPALWHSGLIRFGAAQLNERHERRFGSPMDASAWAGWFVVKLLWEVALREGAAAEGESLQERLVDPATRFDGHKGVGIGFRPDGLLRQPLYLVRTDPDGGSDVVHEGPAAPRGTPFIAAFDALGSSGSPCPGGRVDSAPPPASPVP